LIFFCIAGINIGYCQPNTSYNANTIPISGFGNCAFGNSALSSAGSTTMANTAIGNSSQITTTGIRNTSVGYESMKVNTTGIDNSAIGDGSLFANTTGSYNTAIGRGAMYNNSGGVDNTAIGVDALAYCNSNLNTSIGWQSGYGLTSGAQNIFLGFGAGNSITTGSNNVIIGNGIHGSASLSNTIILGDGSGTVRLYINDAGNAGFGTNTPGNKVEITAGTSLSGLRLSGLAGAGTTPNNTKCLSVNGAGDVIFTNQNSLTAGLGVGVTPFDHGYKVDAFNIYNKDGNINTTAIASDTPNTRTVTMDGNNLFFKTRSNSSEAGTSGTGRIYIGNTMAFSGTSLNFPNITLPDSQYRLLVEGGILTEKVKVALRNSSYWADYVFAADYKLMPLKDVETFVKENKHLPGLSSSGEIVKKGLDLGEMQAKQMEKIEELTLYAIEQNKTLEKQNQEIEALKAQVKILMEKK